MGNPSGGGSTFRQHGRGGEAPTDPERQRRPGTERGRHGTAHTAAPASPPARPSWSGCCRGDDTVLGTGDMGSTMVMAWAVRLLSATLGQRRVMEHFHVFFPNQAKAEVFSVMNAKKEKTSEQITQPLGVGTTLTSTLIPLTRRALAVPAKQATEQQRSLNQPPSKPPRRSRQQSWRRGK